MGVKLKMVPIDFDWPYLKDWKGYSNPYIGKLCTYCNGTGYNSDTKMLDDTWYDWCHHLTEIEVQALLANNRLMILTHIPKLGEWKEKEPKYIPTPEVVNKWSKLWPAPYDTIDRYICVEERAKKLGVYGTCKYCIGGWTWESEEVRQLHDDWKPYDPPTGDGYQLWDDVTVGHPITRVFASIDDLAEYCADLSIPITAGVTLSKREWMESFLGFTKECKKL